MQIGLMILFQKNNDNFHKMNHMRNQTLVSCQELDRCFTTRPYSFLKRIPKAWGQHQCQCPCHNVNSQLKKYFIALSLIVKDSLFEYKICIAYSATFRLLLFFFDTLMVFDNGKWHYINLKCAADDYWIQCGVECV